MRAEDSIQKPEIRVTEYRLKMSRELRRGEVPRLRGFFGREFSEQVLLHHHREDGSLIYDYPRIQFKILDRQAVLIGLEAGSELLTQLWLEVDQAKLGSENLTVQEATIQRRRAIFGETEEMVTYRFLSPWLALNQENTRRYHVEKDRNARIKLLQRILVGNCLSIAKSFRNNVKIRLEADCARLRRVDTRLKGVTMVGFMGMFRVNFLLPDLVGIGKSVSRGFGTVLQIQTEDDTIGAQ